MESPVAAGRCEVWLRAPAYTPLTAAVYQVLCTHRCERVQQRGGDGRCWLLSHHQHHLQQHVRHPCNMRTARAGSQYTCEWYAERDHYGSACANNGYSSPVSVQRTLHWSCCCINTSPELCTTASADPESAVNHAPEPSTASCWLALLASSSTRSPVAPSNATSCTRTCSLGP